MYKFLKNIPAQWKFLILVFLLYVCILLAKAQFAGTIATQFLATLKEVLPIIAVVFFVMFLLNLFIRPEVIKKHLGHDSGFKGWVYTIIASIVIAGPPYVLMPMLADFRRHGMKTSLVAVFLSNRSVQPVFLPVMAYYFGWQYTIIVSVFIVIFSVFSGMIMGKMIEREMIDKS